MAHRGRLNVLANIVGKSYSDIFSEFEGNLDPESVQGSGDVKYHKGARGVFKNPRGATIDVSMASNPSHLEAVSPVVEGIVRAKQDLVIRPSDGTESDGDRGLPVPRGPDPRRRGLRGPGRRRRDAQPLGALGLPRRRRGAHRRSTTRSASRPPESARSSFYPTDVAKMIQAPIFHVNGDDPEACARAARLAFEYREAFSATSCSTSSATDASATTRATTRATPSPRCTRSSINALGAQDLHRDAGAARRHLDRRSRAALNDFNERSRVCSTRCERSRCPS
jgi:2-oxoglutarate decarboxylase